jgi:transposase
MTTSQQALPDPAWLAGKGGRPEQHCRRQIVDAIFYLVDNGIKWRALPADLPPWSTVYKFFAGWEAGGVTRLLLDMLRQRVRLVEGRAATPTAAIVDSQTVKAAENVWRSSRGYDAGKKINGRKRHIAVDTVGLLICVLVTAASVQDRDGAQPLLQRLTEAGHRDRHVWAATRRTVRRPRLRPQEVAQGRTSQRNRAPHSPPRSTPRLRLGRLPVGDRTTNRPVPRYQTPMHPMGTP